MKKAEKIAALERENEELRNYAHQGDVEAAESIRFNALVLANNPDRATDEIVARAKAFADFVLGQSAEDPREV